MSETKVEFFEPTKRSKKEFFTAKKTMDTQKSHKMLQFVTILNCKKWLIGLRPNDVKNSDIFSPLFTERLYGKQGTKIWV